jgi:hypothetical protein
MAGEIIPESRATSVGISNLRGSGTSLRLFQGGPQRGDVVVGSIHGEVVYPQNVGNPRLSWHKIRA